MARSRRPPPTPEPLEHRILLTATLCLLAAGAVMVYSASSARTLLQGDGDGTAYLVKYMMYGGIGLVIMHVLSRRGLEVARRATPLLLWISLGLVLATHLPGVGVTVNGGRRWLGAGPLQFQPSELLKLALVLYAAKLIADEPRQLRTLRGLAKPLLAIIGLSCALVASQPDLGTALVIALAMAALLVAGGVPIRHMATFAAIGIFLVAVFALLEPYRRARLTAFLHPWADPGGAGFQSVQGQIALGSGGLFGVGLGQSVQKIFYLPEAHTDFILAVIGEELGVAGVFGLLFLYGMLAYGGLRAAKAAVGTYAKLVAAGITSLILCQAMLNIFTVLGLAPLTGVPLPFISSGSSSLVVLLAAMGLLLNIASGRAGKLRAVPTKRGGSDADADRDRGRRHSGARGAGARSRRRATG
jgi:cell division protein FtsW